ncbi:hypothetical protein ACEE23_01110 [Corynebacterium sp. 32222D000AT]|uniref:hypothetical protein n=1 Tax=unclassified Corynebacterium TaxID=2624378 RepID=UPI002A9B76D8|nr:hypothetical protein [Mycobacteriaceae bacterium]MDY5829339.1 hypothetical protein [Corynebacterium sp.]
MSVQVRDVQRGGRDGQRRRPVAAPGDVDSGAARRPRLDVVDALAPQRAQLLGIARGAGELEEQGDGIGLPLEALDLAVDGQQRGVAVAGLGGGIAGRGALGGKRGGAEE